MNQKDDRAFIRKFSSIILGLMGITAVIIVLAFSLRVAPDPEKNPSKVLLAEERIAPVAAVRVGAEGQAELAASAAAEAETAASPAESGGAAGAEQIYATVCSACHQAGVAGAPVPGSEEMQNRLAAKGLDGLVSSAISGLNVMPPRGGNPNLSDEDIRATVEFMTQ